MMWKPCALVAGAAIAVALLAPAASAQRSTAPSGSVAAPTWPAQTPPGQSQSPSAMPAVPTAPAAPAPGAAMPSTTVQTGASRPMSSDYVIGPGDVLQISVWKNETLSRVLAVRPDGKISLPLLHDMQASGLTAMQLRDTIAEGLTEYIPTPEASVSVLEVRSLRVSVLGEVQRPGVLELRGATTILEAIAMAGGFRDFASPSRIRVLRRDAGGNTQNLKFNYNRAVNGGSEENLVLMSGDVVVVP